MDADIQDSVVLITSSDPNNRQFGTGFAIYHHGQFTYLLTCSHVVRDVGGNNQVQVGNYQAEVIACALEGGTGDLAVLRVEGLLNIPLLKLEISGKSGNPFIAVGFQSFDKNFLLRPIRGKLGEQTNLVIRGSTDRINTWDLKIIDEYHLQPGYSGSPVLEERNNSVLGIVSHQIGQGKRGVALSIETLPKIWQEMPEGLLEPNEDEQKLSSSQISELLNACSAGLITLESFYDFIKNYPKILLTEDPQTAKAIENILTHAHFFPEIIDEYYFTPSSFNNFLNCAQSLFSDYQSIGTPNVSVFELQDFEQTIEVFRKVVTLIEGLSSPPFSTTFVTSCYDSLYAITQWSNQGKLGREILEEKSFQDSFVCKS